MVTRPTPPIEGYVNVPGGKIYYARMGNGPGTPLIVIHGGPGSSSYGLKAFAALGDERPVIRYDQLGSGKADRPTGRPGYDPLHALVPPVGPRVPEFPCGRVPCHVLSFRAGTGADAHDFALFFRHEFGASSPFPVVPQELAAMPVEE